MLESTKSNLISGGNDGVICFWTETLAKQRTVDLSKIGLIQPGIRAIDFNEGLGTLLVGTRGSDIVEFDSSSNHKVLMRGHFDGELWGCAVHPTKQQFASCGGDKTIRIWTVDSMVACSEPFEVDVKSLDWSADGQFIVAGTANGLVYSIDPLSLEKMSEVRSYLHKQEVDPWIEDLKISPNCQMVAFGTHKGLGRVEIALVK